MAEERRVIETKLSRDDAYTRCFKRAALLGVDIKANVKAERLEVRMGGTRGGGYWTLVVLGFLVYILPGILMLIFWRRTGTCTLLFQDGSEGTTITATVKGEKGRQFFNDVSAVLI